MDSDYLNEVRWKSAIPRVADYLFAFVAFSVIFQRNSDVLDDPGLGWHLRTADLIWESGQFVYDEQFCVSGLGRPWVAYSWLGDFLLNATYRWGGLNGIVVLTAIVFALLARMLFVRMVRDGRPWLAAAVWTLFAIAGTKPAWTARPNMFTFLGLVATVCLCEGFHTGRASRKRTLWLLPLFLIWANVHSGFLSGVMALVVTYLCECALALFGPRDGRAGARARLFWWTCLGCGLLLTTFLNPNGPYLYRHLVSMVGDDFIQRNTTTEWLPPDFSASGWFLLEAAVLLAVLLPALSDRRPAAVSLAIVVVFLHFALTGRRYVPLWIVIAVPTLAAFASDMRPLDQLQAWLTRSTSAGFRRYFLHRRSVSSPLVTVGLTAILLFSCRWWPLVATHDPRNIPVAGLNHLLHVYRGERVFHSVNWGGYLTWHGWELQPRFRTWIDDRLETHSQETWREYVDLMRAAPGYQEVLDREGFELLCLPTETALAQAVNAGAAWEELYRDSYVVIFRRRPTLGPT